MNQPSTARHRTVRTAGAVGLSAVLAMTGLALLGGQAGNASSHREAPKIAGDPQADNTDTYAFVSPDKKNTVTLLANFNGLQEPNGGPNFYPWATDARYNIKIDNTGDGKADITYRWTFKNDDKRGNKTFLYNNGPVRSLKDKTLLFKQRYTLQRIDADGESTTLVRNAIAAPSFTGKASMPNFAKLRKQAVRGFDGGKAKVYAGPADDSFALDLRVFDLLYGADLSKSGQDTLKGYNVNTIALQIPKDDLALRGTAKDNPVIGVWSTTDRKQVTIRAGKQQVMGGGTGPGCDLLAALPGCERTSTQVETATASSGFVQVSRLGNPLINEAVSAAGMKDRFNRTDPSQDHKWGALVDRVTNPEVPQLLEGIYGLKAPAAPRTDLVEIFLTGIGKDLGPIKADLNAFQLNKDFEADTFVPAEMLRLNMNVPVTKNPNRLGVLAGDFQGFPNGRRLGDDVVDIAIQALAGAALTGKLVKALAAGDGVNGNGRSFTRSFPYIAAPNEQAVNTQ